MLALILVLIAVGAKGQSFTDLDFEQAGSSAIPPDTVWLSWDRAAPGWKHAGGGNTLFVYYNPAPTNFTQYYFLIDSGSTHPAPLAGEYSFGFSSGHYSPLDTNSAWVTAFVEQDGLVPANARSFELLATGDLTLKFNSRTISLLNLCGDLYGADISAFAGQEVTLRIENNSLQIQDPVIIDNLRFSPDAIPEPSSVALFGMGVLSLCGAAPRARRGARWTRRA